MSDVNTPIAAYNEMAERWKLPQDLKGGTLAMRRARTQWLPMEQAENSVAYNSRLNRTTLFNGYADALETIADQPFTKPLTLTYEGVDPLGIIESIISNADLQGTNLTQFARELYEDGADYGIAHILVDFPNTEATANALAERQSGVRAILRRICPKDLIGWRSEVNTRGEIELSEVRIRQDEVQEDGDFGEKVEKQVRVIRRNENVVWSGGEDGSDWTPGPATPNSIGKVPLITIYFRRTGFMTARPPLENLAWTNLTHYQSSSDQRNILRVARVGILFGKGFGDDENAFVIGPNNVVLTKNTDADLRYVEYSSDGAIEAGRKDLEDLKAEMQRLGLAPFVETMADTTATGVRHSEGGKQSKAQAWNRAVEDATVEALEMACEWQHQQPPEISAKLFDDFSVINGTNEDAKLLLEARKEGEISRETLWHELKRRRLLDDNLDFTEEAAKLDKETADELKLQIAAMKAVEGELPNDGE